MDKRSKIQQIKQNDDDFLPEELFFSDYGNDEFDQDPSDNGIESSSEDDFVPLGFKGDNASVLIVSIESVVWKLLAEGFTKNLIQKFLTIAESYNVETGKQITVKVLNSLLLNFEAVDKMKVPKDQYEHYYLESKKVTQTVYKKIETFISNENLRLVFVDVEGGHCYGNRSDEVNSFIQDGRLGQGNYKFVKIFDGWETMMIRMFSKILSDQSNFVDSVTQTAIPLITMLTGSEVDVCLDKLGLTVRKLDANSSGYKCKYPFPTVAVSNSPEAFEPVVGSVVLHTVLDQCMDPLEATDPVLVEFDCSSVKEYDPHCGIPGKRGMYCVASTGRVFDIRSNQLDSGSYEQNAGVVDYEDIQPSNEGTIRLLNELNRHGKILVRNAAKTFYKVKWTSPATLESLRSTNQIARVSVETYRSMWQLTQGKKNKKDKKNEEVLIALHVRRFYSFRMIDPWARVIIAIPKVFIAPTSPYGIEINTNGEELAVFGCIMTPGIALRAGMFCTVYSYGRSLLMKEREIPNLDGATIRDIDEYAKYIVSFSTMLRQGMPNTEFFWGFCKQMLITEQHMAKVAWIVAGKKNPDDPHYKAYKEKSYHSVEYTAIEEISYDPDVYVFKDDEGLSEGFLGENSFGEDQGGSGFAKRLKEKRELERNTGPFSFQPVEESGGGLTSSTLRDESLEDSTQ